MTVTAQKDISFIIMGAVPNFTSMIQLKSQNGHVITYVTKCGIKFLIHFNTSTVQQLKFEYGLVILSHIFNWTCDYQSMLGLKLNHVSERGTRCNMLLIYVTGYLTPLVRKHSFIILILDVTDILPHISFGSWNWSLLMVSIFGNHGRHLTVLLFCIKSYYIKYSKLLPHTTGANELNGQFLNVYHHDTLVPLIILHDINVKYGDHSSPF